MVTIVFKHREYVDMVTIVIHIEENVGPSYSYDCLQTKNTQILKKLYVMSY